MPRGLTKVVVMSRLSFKGGLVTGRWQLLGFVPSSLPFLLRSKKQVSSILIFQRSRIFYLDLESLVTWLGHFNVAKMRISKEAYSMCVS